MAIRHLEYPIVLYFRCADALSMSRPGGSIFIPDTGDMQLLQKGSVKLMSRLRPHL